VIARRQISATVIADSVSQYGDRISTLELTFPRFLLAELNTHRDFSRNSASSRARSTKKTIQEVREDPFVPTHWPSERVGMAGGAEITGMIAENIAGLWRFASEQAVERADDLVLYGVHKSIINRLLEPFMWHTAVVTATHWDNFFAQRLALLDDGTPAAEPHFYDLAREMSCALAESTPRNLADDQWHLPYVSPAELELITGSNTLRLAIKLSVARCAGVSYLNQSADRPQERDLALYERLVTADPPHWSPFEHVARPRSSRALVSPRHYNLTGWASLRWYREAGGASLADVTTS
jgi:hypothetical protein